MPLMCAICEDNICRSQSSPTVVRPGPRRPTKPQKENTDYPVTTFCGHFYHNACILKWLTTSGKNNCPYCQKSVNGSKELIRIYPLEDEEEVPRTPSPPTNGTLPVRIPTRQTNGPNSIGNLTLEQSPLDQDLWSSICDSMKTIAELQDMNKDLHRILSFVEDENAALKIELAQVKMEMAKRNN